MANPERSTSLVHVPTQESDAHVDSSSPDDTTLRANTIVDYRHEVVTKFSNLLDAVGKAETYKSQGNVPVLQYEAKYVVDAKLEPRIVSFILSSDTPQVLKTAVMNMLADDMKSDALRAEAKRLIAEKAHVAQSGVVFEKWMESPTE